MPPPPISFRARWMRWCGLVDQAGGAAYLATPPILARIAVVMPYMSITEFNRNVSAAIARVEKGEELTLTRHGKQVARLSAPDLEKRRAQKEADLTLLREIMRAGMNFGGPATYEERTERWS